MGRIILAIVISVVLTLSAFSQPASAPASAPATAPVRAVKVKLDTPESAVREYATAMRDGDVEKLRACLRMTSAQDKEAAASVEKWVAGSARLHNAAVKKFGNDGAAQIAAGMVAVPRADVQAQQILQSLKDNAPAAEVNGDRATVAVDVSDVQLAKVGTEWKVCFELPPGEDAVEANKMLDRMGTHFDSLGKDIEKGKYVKAADVVEELSGKASDPVALPAPKP